MVFLCLAERAGEFVPGSELLDRLYGDDPEGGPVTAVNCVCVHVSRMKKKLEPHGITVEGWRDGHYRRGRRLVVTGETDDRR